MKVAVSILILVSATCWVRAQDPTESSPTEASTTESGAQCEGRRLGNIIPTLGTEDKVYHSVSNTSSWWKIIYNDPYS